MCTAPILVLIDAMRTLMPLTWVDEPVVVRGFVTMEGGPLTEYYPRVDDLSQRTRHGRATARSLVALAILIGLASVAFGVVLIAHATYHCGFAPSGDTYCDPAQHPWEPAGFAMILGGVATAGLLAAVGKLIQIFADTRYSMSSRHELISDPL